MIIIQKIFWRQLELVEANNRKGGTTQKFADLGPRIGKSMYKF
jgi:hypothetical protein